MTTTAEQIEAVATELGLSMTAEFVAWSKSRNKGEKQPSLNWKVTIYRAATAPGRSPLVVLTTDYGAGSGHYPGYGSRDRYSEKLIVPMECETGKVCRYHASGGTAAPTTTPILPKFADVLYSLVSDADLDIALKLRNGIGEAGLKQLREACQDY